LPAASIVPSTGISRGHDAEGGDIRNNAFALNWNRYAVPIERKPLYLSEVTAADGMAYRKIFDVTHAIIGEVDKQALVSLGRRVSDYGRSGELGPIAIVAQSDASYGAARIYAANAVASRPIQIFRELHDARAWLDRLGA